jgi:hypothetical protein
MNAFTQFPHQNTILAGIVKRFLAIGRLHEQGMSIFGLGWSVSMTRL